MSVDRELVTRKMTLIVRDLERLGAIHLGGVSAYCENAVNQAVVERYLERLIGRMIDINYHLITEMGDAPPADYHASFLRLAEIKILGVEFAARIARSAGLRNRLVHEYDEIDPRKVFEALGAALDDVPAYLDKVNAFLDQRS